MKANMLLLFAIVGMALAAPAPAPAPKPQVVYSYASPLAYSPYAAPVVAADTAVYAGYVPYSAVGYGYNYPGYVYV